MTATSMMRSDDFSSGGDAKGFCKGEDSNRRDKQAKTGLWVLMAVITSLFFLFFIAFMIRSQLSDWEHLSSPWKPLERPWQLWLNTVFLCLASVFLQCASWSAGRQKTVDAVRYLAVGGFFTSAFIVGQLLVWQGLIQLGYVMNGNPANSFFYLLTGLHGLHLFGGMIAWSRPMQNLWCGGDIKQSELAIQLCARYWHYLLLLWFLLLVLLTGSPETYEFLARLCGLR